MKRSGGKGQLLATVAATSLGAALVLSPDFAVAQTNAPKASPPAATADAAKDPTAPIATAPRVTAGAPKGFDDVSQAINTQFDLTFQGRRIGSFQAVLENGQFHFVDPGSVVDALGKDVIQADVLRLVSQSMPSNEQLICPPGRTVGCGILPAGVSGVIVDPMTFQVTLFVGREYLQSAVSGPRYMPEPISGPSFIQNVNLVAAGAAGHGGTGSQGGDVGVVLNTVASNGRNSLVVDTFADSLQGSYLQDAYAQHIGKDWRLAGGILYSDNSATLTNFRLAGIELASFSKTRLDSDQFVATPVQVALARTATVEIYRNGVLIFARQLPAGLQTVDTSELPSGSYPIRVVIQDGGSILSDQTQAFVKANDLPPPGKTNFFFRAGLAGPDAQSISGVGQSVDFLPAFEETLLQIGASHRLGTASSGSLTMSLIGSNVYPELEYQTYMGFLRGVAGVAVSSGGGYAAFAGLTATLKDISGSLSLRSVDADRNLTTVVDPRKYQPFSNTETDVALSLQFPLVGGNVSMQTSYTQRRDFNSNYSFGLAYARNLKETRFGTPRLLLNLIKNDQETRGTITISFFRRLNQHSNVQVEAGVDSISGSRGGDPNGISPTVDASYTRTDTIGKVDVASTEGVVIDETQRRVYTDVHGLSSYGEVEGNLSYGQEQSGPANLQYTTSIKTGFAIGGGAVKWGLRQAGDAVVIMDIEADRSVMKPSVSLAGGGALPSDINSASSAPGSIANPFEERRVTEGGYRASINDQPFDRIDVGQKSAIGLPAFRVYNVTLAPDGAPPFDVDLTPRQVPLFPGNVVHLHWKGQVVVTMFGRLVDGAGVPIRNARLETTGDRTITDDAGYFTVTALTTEDLSVRTPDGRNCSVPSPPAISDPANKSFSFRRVGTVTCIAH